jgi:hypothetical protein
MDVEKTAESMQRFATTDLDKNITFLEMDSRQRNASYNLLKIEASTHLAEQVNVMRDVSGTALSTQKNATMYQENDLCVFNPIDVFLSANYLQSQALPSNQSFFANYNQSNKVSAQLGLDMILGEQSRTERENAQILGGSATGRLYYCKFVTETIYKTLLAL